jgi:MFS family permease
VVAGVQAVLKQVNDPAKVAFVPRLVPAEELVAVNTLIATGASIARLVGAPLGGLLAGASSLAWVVVVDGVSFVLVALATTAVRADTSHASLGVDRVPGGVRAGLVEIHRHRHLRDLLAGLVGAVVVARVAGRVSAPTLMFAGYVGMGVVALVFWHAPAVTTSVWVYVLLFAASGIPGAAMQVGLQTTVQLASPVGALGRVWGVMAAAGALGEALGATIAAIGLDEVPLQALLDVQALIYVVCGVVGWWTLSSAGAAGRLTSRVADRRREPLERAGQPEHLVVAPPPTDELGADGQAVAAHTAREGRAGPR